MITIMICDYRLKVFYTVAVKGSFTAAAKELGITQPAVSITFQNWKAP